MFNNRNEGQPQNAYAHPPVFVTTQPEQFQSPHLPYPQQSQQPQQTNLYPQVMVTQPYYPPQPTMYPAPQQGWTQCQLCGAVGHSASQCPTLVRQPTTPSPIFYPQYPQQYAQPTQYPQQYTQPQYPQYPTPQQYPIQPIQQQQPQQHQQFYPQSAPLNTFDTNQGGPIQTQPQPQQQPHHQGEENKQAWHSVVDSLHFMHQMQSMPNNEAGNPSTQEPSNNSNRREGAQQLKNLSAMAPPVSPRNTNAPPVSPRKNNNQPPPQHAPAVPPRPQPHHPSGPPPAPQQQQPLQPQRRPGGLDTETPRLSDEIQREIGMFQLEGYANHYFKSRKQGVFRRRVPVQELLVWTKETVHSSLLIHAKQTEADKLSVRAFKIIQRYMGDLEVEGKRGGPDELAIELITIGCEHPGMRDEIFIQLCRQTTLNPSRDSTYLGWELLIIAIASFAPSKDLEGHLAVFIQSHTSFPDERITTMARHALKRLGVKCKAAGVPHILSKLEVQRAREMVSAMSIFDCTLEEVMALQKTSYPDLTLPAILVKATEALVRANCFATQGIFRISAEAAELGKLEARIDKGDLSFQGNSPHEIAGILKAWIKRLAEPIVPNQNYAECIKYCQDARAIESIIHQLPPLNRDVLLHLLRFLQSLAQPQVVSQTKMSAGNLALLFSPLLLRCPDSDPMVLLTNTRFESDFVYSCVTALNL